jgi:phosphohistidine phosphatase SixA
MNPHMTIQKLTLCAVWLLASAWAQASDLAQKLQSNDHVLLMRHTLAPGVGDPENYTLADCKTQRNLSTEGRKQAIATGQWLKKQGVTQAEVYTSPWCRCKDTAALLKLAPPHIERSLASFFDEMHQAQASQLALQKFISEKIKTKGQNALILVTHHVNILEFAGENIASGDMVLAKVNASGQMVSYQLIPRPH